MLIDDEQFVAPPEEALVVGLAGVPGGVMDRMFGLKRQLRRPNLILCRTGVKTKNVD
jgi:hypothetical protein